MYHRKVNFITNLKKKGEHGLAECNQKLEGKFIHCKNTKPKQGKEIIQIVKECHREIIVPSSDVNNSPLIVSKSEYEKFKRLTPAEICAKVRENERQLLLAQKESNIRKGIMKQAQANKMKSFDGKPKLNEMDENKQYVLERAKELLAENQPEVKYINSLILATKVKLIREAQLAEKQLLKREQEDENRRLDSIMEESCKLKIRAENKQCDENAEKTKKFIAMQRQQMKEAQLMKTKALELKEQEATSTNKALIALQHEEVEKVRLKNQRKYVVQEELRKAKEERSLFIHKRKQDEILADKRRAEFLKMKHQREEEFEKERAAIKAAKEIEVARLGAAQKREQDHQAQIFEQNAITVQEERERAYRSNIKQAAIKRREDNAKLNLERQQQIEDVRKAQALRIEKEKKLCRTIASDQRIMIARIREHHRLQREKDAENRKFILKQLEERERERHNRKKLIMETGNAFRIEMQLRDLEISETLKRKLESLQKINFPEQCIKDIQRQVRLQFRTRNIS